MEEDKAGIKVGIKVEVERKEKLNFHNLQGVLTSAKETPYPKHEV